MNHFRIRLAGRTDWMDLYQSDINLNDTKAILDEYLNPLGEMEEFTEELIYSLEEAISESKKQFSGKKWEISNGEIIHTKGQKIKITVEGKPVSQPLTFPAPTNIFETGKVSIPDGGVKVVRRNLDGSLFSKRVFPSEKSFGKFDKNLMAIRNLKHLTTTKGSAILPLVE